MAKVFGLELAGAKNLKTSLAVMEQYARPKENKTFLLDLYTGLGQVDQVSADHLLLDALDECLADRKKGEKVWMGVNVPLTLPPCTRCTKRVCPLPERCTVQAVKWMRTHAPVHGAASALTPYTQRPVELYFKDILHDVGQPSMDDALGGARAALTARMVFLKPHLEARHIQLVEVYPRLASHMLGAGLGAPGRILRNLRHLEHGVAARRWLMERWIERTSTFIYDRDLEKMIHHLGAFDAWVCAWVAQLASLGQVRKPPKGFPIASGWIHCPL